MPEEITVLLVDDHALVRNALRRLLEDEADLTVVGEASDGFEAVQKARALRPKVVLMDCAMPGMDGLLATRAIVGTFPKIAVLILSMHSEDTWVRRAIAAGASGYVLKNAKNMDLAGAIKRVDAGERLFEPQASSSKNGRASALTRRELEILQLIVDGKSTKEIAMQLRISQNTVGVHRANIMSTIGVRKTAELVVYAIQNGLVNIL
jgi:DNA-binding NarL/FixJ family response regulator